MENMRILKKINIDLDIIECINTLSESTNKSLDELYNYFLRQGLTIYLKKIEVIK